MTTQNNPGLPHETIPPMAVVYRFPARGDAAPPVPRRRGFLVDAGAKARGAARFVAERVLGTLILALQFRLIDHWIDQVIAQHPVLGFLQ